MTFLRNSHNSLWLAALAVGAFVCETVAWWWVTQLSGGQSLQGATFLGLIGALCALAASVLLWRKISAAKLETRRTRQLLASSLDTLDMGLEIWDKQDRLMLYNKKISLMRIDFHTPADIGQTFETLVRAKLERHLIPAAIGREEDWLAQRLATRGTHKTPQLKKFAGNQWINSYEARTPEGYLVASWIDVTELVRKGNMLEASNQRLAQQSSMDELTGLANRRRFDEALAVEWQRAARGVTPLSLLMVDIDHFKQYNDNYGHVAGDECLRRVAAVLDRCVRRAGEIVARYGGEEFVLLLPGADMAHACETAQQCLELMQKEAIPHVASQTRAQVTFSIGVACLLPDATLDPTILINAADTAMYRAKSDGRARYEVADQADWDIDKDTPRTRPSPLS
jgi:diguanylate cyclase (GGDEF)-like protein